MLTALAAFVVLRLHRSHFDWHAFWVNCRSARPAMLLLAAFLICFGFVFRAARWAVFLKPALAPGQRARWTSLLPAQCIGFASLALFGRVAELVRPYLISRRTGLPFASQVAVVAVERIFDLGAFAILFSGNLILSPQLQNLPYHERFHLLGYTISALTAVLCAFVLTVRLAGAATARFVDRLEKRFWPRRDGRAAERVLQFRDGLNVVGSVGDFLQIALHSLLLWATVAAAYIAVVRAFPEPVHNLTVAHILLLMGFSVVGSLVQLPGIGGGPQAMTIGAMTTLFRIPAEQAASAGMVLYVVITLSVLLPGLLLARVEQVSLRSLRSQSAAAETEPHHLVN